MSEWIRAFIALPLSSEIRHELFRVTKQLELRSIKVKWTELENFHITLKFLGDTPLEYVPRIERAIGEISSKYSAIQIQLKELGAFPSIHRPRVFWVGVEESNAPVIGSIASEIEDAMHGLGFAREARKFSSHITLGRTKSQDISTSDKNMLTRVTLKHDFSLLQNIVLMKSELTPRGAIYKTLFSAELKK